MSPVAKPWSLASSRIVFCGSPLMLTPSAPLYVLVPVDHAGRARGRVGDVVRLAVLVQRVGGVLPRQREGVEPGEEAARTLLVVAGEGDLGVAHAVTEQQDHVLGARAVDGVADRLALVAAEPAGAAGGGQFAVRGAA